MRTIDEIKADIASVENIVGRNENYTKQYDDELRMTLVDGIPLDCLEEICNAERDGRCVVLPCKVGDTVYVDTRTFFNGRYNGRSHAEALVTSFVFGHRDFVKFRIFSPYVSPHKVFKYPRSSFGKTVFLSREEAEAALKEGVKE